MKKIIIWLLITVIIVGYLSYSRKNTPPLDPNLYVPSLLKNHQVFIDQYIFEEGTQEHVSILNWKSTSKEVESMFSLSSSWILSEGVSSINDDFNLHYETNGSQDGFTFSGHIERYYTGDLSYIKINNLSRDYKKYKNQEELFSVILNNIKSKWISLKHEWINSILQQRFYLWNIAELIASLINILQQTSDYTQNLLGDDQKTTMIQAITTFAKRYSFSWFNQQAIEKPNLMSYNLIYGLNKQHNLFFSWVSHPYRDNSVTLELSNTTLSLLLYDTYSPSKIVFTRSIDDSFISIKVSDRNTWELIYLQWIINIKEEHGILRWSFNGTASVVLQGLILPLWEKVLDYKIEREAKYKRISHGGLSKDIHEVQSINDVLSTIRF